MGTRTVIISNSTPLINFAAIQRLDILETLFGKIWIPTAVERELLEKGKLYPSTEAITLAVEQNAQWLLLDEERGRTIAASSTIFPVWGPLVALSARSASG